MKHIYLLRLAVLLGLLALASAARAQNVGIGTTAPTQTLDVNGSLRVRGLTGSGAGRLLGVADDGTIQAQPSVSDATATASPQATTDLGTIPINSSRAITVNPAGTRAYVVAGNSIQTYDVSNSLPLSIGTTIDNSNGGQNGICIGAVVNSAGNRLYVGYIVGGISIFDTSSGLPVYLSNFLLSDKPTSFAINPAGTRLYAALTQAIETYDVSGSTPVSLSIVNSMAYRGIIAVNGAGTRAYVTGSGVLETFDVSSNTPVSLGTTPSSTSVGVNATVKNIALNSAGTRIYTVNAVNNTLETYDLSSGLPVSLGTVPTGARPQNIALNPAGTRAFVENFTDNTLQTFDVSGSTPVSLGTLSTTGTNLNLMAVNPNGTRLYALHQDNLETFSIGSARLVVVGSDGSLGSVDLHSLPGDNLGNHTATQNLNLADNQLVGNGSQGLAISSSGQVGIGTRSPTALLDVNGSARLRGLTTAGLVATDASGNLASVATSSLGDNLGNHAATQNLNLATYQLVGNGGSQGISISSGGNVGIGLTAPAVALHVAGQTRTNTGMQFADRSSPANNFEWYDNAGVARLYSTVGGLDALGVTTGGNVGIGTTSPTQLLELGGQAAPALLLHSTSNNLVTGATLQFRESSTAYGWNLRHNNGGSEGSSTNDRLVLERLNGAAATPVMVWDQTNGQVGIGTTTPAYALDVVGNLNVSGQVRSNGQVLLSDARLKMQVRPLTSALASVLALRGVRYRWNALGVAHGGLAGAEQVGLLAQELERVYPELVSTGPDGYKAVNYAQLTPVLLEAIKELAAQNETLRAQLVGQQRTTQAQLARFEQRLRALEATGLQAEATNYRVAPGQPALR